MKRAALALLALLAPASLRAQDPWSLSFGGSLDLLVQKNHLAEDENQYQHALNLVGDWGPFSASFTLRGVNFYKQQPNLTLEKSDWSLYRKNLRYSQDGLSIQGGDFYAALGQGLVLSVLPNDKTLRERSIDGAEVQWERGPFQARALTGSVTTEVKDEEWRVQGAEASLEFLPGNRVGLRSATVRDVRSYLQLGERTTSSFSLSGARLPGGLGYYLEAGRLAFQRPDLEEGRGLYANLSLRRGPFYGLLEHKRYKNFDNELNNPPLADKDDELNQLQDGEATRLYLSYALGGRNVTVFASTGPVREGLLSGHQVQGGFTAEELFGDRLTASLSWFQKTLAYPVKKVDASLIYRFTPLWSAEWVLRDKRYDTQGFLFHEQDQTYQVARSKWGALYFMRQYSEALVFDAHVLYSGGLRLQLPRDAYLDLSGGRQRGGQVCAGGQCIFLPPFRGWKAMVHLPFRWRSRS